MRRSFVSPVLAVIATVGLLSYSSVASAQAAATPENGTDHDGVVGHFAVGYFGISALPIGSGTPGNGNVTTGAAIQAPVIGARYWFAHNIGLDAGVGFSDSSSGWGVALHGGLPIALASAKHMTFELVPEATIAFAGNSVTGNTAATDVTYSGFLLDLGARIGGEIQFGFIGIPQLALQASVGLSLQHKSYGVSNASTSGSVGTTTFATTVGSDPWGIFTDNISALYYF